MQKTTIKNGKEINEPEFDVNDIFKFGLFKDLERTLQDCTLGFSKFENYNDPFEGNFQYVHRFKSLSDKTSFIRNVTKSPHYKFQRKMRNDIDNILSQYVMSCFSKNPIEPLMWSHYSNKHTGICYCFNVGTIFDRSVYDFGEIKYSNLLPEVNFFDGFSTIGSMKPEIRNVLLAKSDKWTYEKECRFFLESKIMVHNFIPNSLEGIILGSKIKDSEILIIKDLINKYNKKHGTDVAIMYASPLKISYEMSIGYDKATQEKTTIPIYDTSFPVITV